MQSRKSLLRFLRKFLKRVDRVDSNHDFLFAKIKFVGTIWLTHRPRNAKNLQYAYHISLLFRRRLFESDSNTPAWWFNCDALISTMMMTRKMTRIIRPIVLTRNENKPTSGGRIARLWRILLRILLKKLRYLGVGEGGLYAFLDRADRASAASRSQETAHVSHHKSCVDERIFIIRYLAMFGRCSYVAGGWWHSRSLLIATQRRGQGERDARTIRRRRLLSRFAL